MTREATPTHYSLRPLSPDTQFNLAGARSWIHERALRQAKRDERADKWLCSLGQPARACFSLIQRNLDSVCLRPAVYGLIYAIACPGIPTSIPKQRDEFSGERLCLCIS